MKAYIDKWMEENPPPPLTPEQINIILPIWCPDLAASRKEESAERCRRAWEDRKAEMAQRSIPVSRVDDLSPSQSLPRPMRSARTVLYRHYDQERILLYVGITDHLVARTNQHCNGADWRGLVASSTIEWFSTRDEAEAAEREAVKRERPIFNVVYSGPDLLTRRADYLNRKGRNNDRSRDSSKDRREDQ